MGARKENLIGKRFGRLLVIEQAESKRYSGKIKRRWLCKCDCGNDNIVETGRLNSGKTISCGCYHAETAAENGRKSRVKIIKKDAPRNAVASTYRVSAKSRNLEFNLSNEELDELFKGNCFYCGAEPSNLYSTKHYHFSYNGIDRINNDLGYNYKNCVSCCFTCNKAKGKMTSDDFIIWVDKIYNHLIKK